MKERSDFSQEVVDKMLDIIENQDYEAVKYIFEWKGYSVFAKTFVNQHMFLGLPSYILVKNDKVREATYEECREIDNIRFAK